MTLNSNDTYPLWSFGYRSPPDHDEVKVMTSRGRTWQEAWTCVQEVNCSFLEPEKMGLIGTVRIVDREDYSFTHQYDWFHEAPLWLKIREGVPDQIW